MIEYTTTISPDRSKPTVSSSERGQHFDSDAEFSTSENMKPEQLKPDFKVPSRDMANLTEIGKRGLQDRWHSLL